MTQQIGTIWSDIQIEDDIREPGPSSKVAANLKTVGA